MWEARAIYADGYTVERYFEPSAYLTESEDQYNIECWLLDRHPDCIWYSVNWVDEI